MTGNSQGPQRGLKGGGKEHWGQRKEPPISSEGRAKSRPKVLFCYENEVDGKKTLSLGQNVRTGLKKIERKKDDPERGAFPRARLLKKPRKAPRPAATKTLLRGKKERAIS